MPSAGTTVLESTSCCSSSSSTHKHTKLNLVRPAPALASAAIANAGAAAVVTTAAEVCTRHVSVGALAGAGCCQRIRGSSVPRPGPPAPRSSTAPPPGSWWCSLLLLCPLGNISPRCTAITTTTRSRFATSLQEGARGLTVEALAAEASTTAWRSVAFPSQRVVLAPAVAAG